MTELKNNNRSISVDIIRLLALYLVNCVHFFLKTGFYKVEQTGAAIYFMTVLRNSFMICVPLFMIITGYLMNKKTLTKDYYKRLPSIIGIYVLSSILCFLYDALLNKKAISVLRIVRDILTFDAAKYSWYVRMYLGLFIIIPFLNLIYNNLSTKKQKQILIVSFALLTVVPMTLNRFDFTTKLPWYQLMSSNDPDKIFPSWWIDIFPITYYFVGCYIKEFQPKIKKFQGILVLITSIFATGTFYFISFCGKNHPAGSLNDYAKLEFFFISILVFLLLYDLDFNKLRDKTKKRIVKFSSLTLGAFLVSAIFDDFNYKILNYFITDFSKKVHFFPLTTILTFTFSLLVSALIQKIYNLIAKLASKLYSKIKKTNKITAP